MARKTQHIEFLSPRGNKRKKKTAQGKSSTTKYKNKHKKRNKKASRGQG